MRSNSELWTRCMITAPMGRWRAVVAFLVAPLIIPFVFLVPFSSRDTGPVPGSRLASFLAYSVYALPIAYIAELLLGVPAWMVFQYYRIRSMAAFAAVGALIGWIVYLSMSVLAGNLTSHPLATIFNPFSSPYLPICVVAGSGSATLFRTIAFSFDQAKEDRR